MAFLLFLEIVYYGLPYVPQPFLRLDRGFLDLPAKIFIPTIFRQTPTLSKSFHIPNSNYPYVGLSSPRIFWGV